MIKSFTMRKVITLLFCMWVFFYINLFVSSSLRHIKSLLRVYRDKLLQTDVICWLNLKKTVCANATCCWRAAGDSLLPLCWILALGLNHYLTHQRGGQRAPAASLLSLHSGGVSLSKYLLHHNIKPWDTQPSRLPWPSTHRREDTSPSELEP